MWIVRLVGQGVFKSVAFATALGVIVALFVYDASILVAVEDLNLALIKWVALQLPPWYGSEFEAGMRFLGDRSLMLVEAIGAVKLLLAVLLTPFRREHH